MSEINITEDVTQPDSSAGDPFDSVEANEAIGEEGDSGEVSPNANRRIQELTQERKKRDEQIQRLEQQQAQTAQQNEQLRQALLQQLNQSKSNSSTEPKPTSTYDPEMENIISDLGGDDTAKKLYDVLGRRYMKAAQEGGLAKKDEIIQEVDQRIRGALGTVQATQEVPNRIQEWQTKGRLDAKEAKWVSEKVVAATQADPRWMANKAWARQLVDNVINAGLDSGDIIFGEKSTQGSNTLLSPGGNGNPNPVDETMADARKAAKLFRTTRNLNDKQIAKYAKGMQASGPNNQVNLNELIKG